MPTFDRGDVSQSYLYCQPLNVSVVVSNKKLSFTPENVKNAAHKAAANSPISEHSSEMTESR